MGLKLITGPTEEPITREEAKLHLRVITDPADVSAHPDDALVDRLITAAREGAEQITGRALMLQTIELAVDCFSELLRLPKPPVAEVVSVKYCDADGVLRTVDPSKYLLDDFAEPAMLLPSYGVQWPSARRQKNAVTVQYKAGYADTASVPAGIKQWMLLQIGAMYENREAVASGMSLVELPFADRLLDPYRIWVA